jgi:hypothetical protein
MIHFAYLVGFAVLVSIAFAVFTAGDTRQKVIAGVKAFFQFLLISLAMAWIFYFIPW